MMQPAILTLEGVTKRFHHTLPPAVDQVSLAVQPGELISVLGASGCGKTTLLRLIAGFEQPDAGCIWLADQVVSGTAWVPPERRQVGMVFQDYALFPHLTVAENIAFGLRQGSYRRFSRRQRQQRVAETISLVRLEGFDRRYPHQLSGGQQQRVALARALAARPKLLLMDEPFSNLDVGVRLELRQDVRDILKRLGMSALLVTHDQEEALSFADRVGVMHLGKMEQFSPAEEIYRQPASRFVAEFVTQANFLPVQHQGDQWVTDFGILPEEANKLDYDRNTVNLMLRQEEIRLTQKDEPGVIATICDRQFLGRDYRYRIQLPSGQHLNMRLPATTSLTIGQQVTIAAPYASSQLFLGSKPYSSPSQSATSSKHKP